jgi:hypothetical protein
MKTWKELGTGSSPMLDTEVESPASLVCHAVRRDPTRFLDQLITPFATPRSLMGGPPPPRWRLLARRRWFVRLAARVSHEVTRQEIFARLSRESAERFEALLVLWKTSLGSLRYMDSRGVAIVSKQPGVGS